VSGHPFEPAGSPPDLATFRHELRLWLDEHRLTLPSSIEEAAKLSTRLELLQTLQRQLFEAGWARYGWPVEVGGLGGDARHRAVLYEELAAAGHPTRIAYEHLEILAPAMVAHWDWTRLAELLPRLLDGSELWCQGFSEPDAGSDLIALSTYAVRDGAQYRLTGRKIWTSWAAYARRCVVLARTGAREDRQRGLTAFVVDLEADGVEVRGLRQANGLDELGEVVFDDVRVPVADRIGAEGSGWQFGMDVLSCERSAFAWLRHIRLFSALDSLATIASDHDEQDLGRSAVDLLAVRCASGRAVQRLAEGTFLGPHAAPVKLALTDAEQGFYDIARKVIGPALALGGGSMPMQSWQEDYLFSRVVSIYGGTRQIQLGTVARFLLGLPQGPK
jgi:alkylation response protein AidB-like acyl-CoA dehydrogenase